MRKMVLAVMAIVALGRIGSAGAQVYSTRPITMTVPFAAGGPLDAVARFVAGGPLDAVARFVAERMPIGQRVIIENVVGANGSIGVGRVARATPDGYTLVIGSWNTHAANGALYALSYD